MILRLVGQERDGAPGGIDGLLPHTVVGASGTDGECGGGGEAGECGAERQQSGPTGGHHGVLRRTNTAVPEPSDSWVPNCVVHHLTCIWSGERSVRSNSPLAPELDSQSNF